MKLTSIFVSLAFVALACAQCSGNACGLSTPVTIPSVTVTGEITVPVTIPGVITTTLTIGTTIVETATIGGACCTDFTCATVSTPTDAPFTITVPQTVTVAVPPSPLPPIATVTVVVPSVALTGTVDLPSVTLPGLGVSFWVNP